MSDGRPTYEELLQENRHLRERVRQLETGLVSRLVENWTEQFFEGIPMGVVKLGLEGRVEFANSDAQRFLGIGYDVLEARYVNDFSGSTFKEDGSVCPAEDYPAARCLMTGQPQPAMIVGVEQRTGEIHWGVFAAIPTYDEVHAGRPDGALVTFVDVTDIQRERLQQRAGESRLIEAARLEALGKLAGGVAHDMNNILAVVSGMAFVLSQRENETEATCDEAVEAILRSCRRGRDLIRNLLGFARRGPGRRRLVVVNETVREVESLLSRALPDDVVLDVDLAPVLPTVEADPSELTTMLMNLCLNAADALADVDDPTRELRITVTTGVGPCEQLGDRGEEFVLLTVADNGCGIPESLHAKVFEPFFTTKPVGQGTGLGLSMVYGTVQSHGGYVEIESTQGAGTCITVCLPICRVVDARHHASSDLLPALSRSKLRSKNDPVVVLVVEDDPDVLRTTTRIISTLGHRAVPASSGREALEVLHTGLEPIAFVLLDVRMPEMDGEALFEHLRALDPTLPVMLTSGHAEEARINRMLDAGALGLLRKPIDIDTLREALESLRLLAGG